jgi:hypothetical protein
MHPELQEQTETPRTCPPCGAFSFPPGLLRGIMEMLPAIMAPRQARP